MTSPELPCASVSSEFDLHENGSLGGTHFHIDGFEQRFVFTKRQNASNSSNPLQTLTAIDQVFIQTAFCQPNTNNIF